MDNQINILIVEDEALIAENIKIFLEGFGYNVADVCYKFEKAEKALYELEYDVLITDINLGHGIDEKSGLVLARQLKNYKDTPIIFLTAFSDKDTVRKATTLSPSAYLVKPVNEANLFAAVQLAVENFIKKKPAVIEKEEKPDYFFAKNGKRLIKIFWKDVYHLEYVKNYVKIKSSEHENPILIRGFLKKVLDNMIPPHLKDDFIKINRGEVIAKTNIININKEFVETTYGTYKVSSEFDIDEL